MSRAAGRRLFFALWPEPSFARQLLGLPGAIGAEPVQVADLHLTVLFLGRVPEHLVAPLAAAAGQLRLPLVRQPLLRLEAWPESGVLCLVGEPVAALDELRQALGRIAAAAGLVLAREQQEFRAHVTLARRIMPSRFSAPALEPLVLLSGRFSLAESVPQPDGRRYQILQSWPLE
jgi:2'-5' RNA ligase